LRLQPSLKAAAEKFALVEGTSLDQFINGAVAEKLSAPGAGDKPPVDVDIVGRIRELPRKPRRSGRRELAGSGQAALELVRAVSGRRYTS
jgi:hypothetical protein